MLLKGFPGSVKGLQGDFRIDELEVHVNIQGREQNGDQYEQSLKFQTDRIDFGAALLLALAGRSEALFTWMGKSTEVTWSMRTYWFSRDVKERAIEFLKELRDKEQADIDKERLKSLIKQLKRPPLFVLRIDQLDEAEEQQSFIFPLSNITLAKFLREITSANDSSVRLIGGLRVVVNEGTVSLAAGNSSLLALSNEQRTGLSLSLQRLLEADAVIGMRMGEVGFFVPRGEGSVWDKGPRISVLGRTVPITDIRDAARLAVVL